MSCHIAKTRYREKKIFGFWVDIVAVVRILVCIFDGLCDFFLFDFSLFLPRQTYTIFWHTSCDVYVCICILVYMLFMHIRYRFTQSALRTRRQLNLESNSLKKTTKNITKLYRLYTRVGLFVYIYMHFTCSPFVALYIYI